MRKKRDVDLLKSRLDVYSDEWRTAQPDPITKVKMPTNLTPTGKVRKPRLKKNSTPSINAQVNAEPDTKPITEGKLSKRKRSKSDKVCCLRANFCIFSPIFTMPNELNQFYLFCIYAIYRKRIQTHRNDRPIHFSSFVRSNDRF